MSLSKVSSDVSWWRNKVNLLKAIYPRSQSPLFSSLGTRAKKIYLKRGKVHINWNFILMILKSRVAPTGLSNFHGVLPIKQRQQLSPQQTLQMLLFSLLSPIAYSNLLYDLSCHEFPVSCSVLEDPTGNRRIWTTTHIVSVFPHYWIDFI